MAESVTVDTLEIEIESRAKGVFTNLDALTDSMTRLKAAVKGGAGLTAVKKQLESLNTSLNSININTGKIGELATALGSLSTVQKASGLTSTINALKKLPQITASLNATDLNAFGAKMREVAAAVRPLANEMQKVSKGFSAFPIRIQKIIQSSNGLAASNAKASKSFSLLGAGLSATAAKLGLYYLAFKRLASKISEWITESNAYVENLNLFTVAMGKSAESAKAFAEEVQRAMGIDPSEWMRNQGVFMQISTGFGVVSEKAALMSQNMTQLGYDISSFFNISTADAMQKLQSGIAGEIEPLRRLGYAIDVATLQQVAFRHGITQSVNTMNQAQKSQLRYIAIMEQSGNVMGDLARTITTPANAMRILKQQTVQLSRALGNIFVPVIQALLPWVQAFVSLLTDAANAIAAFVGFEIPKIDYSNLGGLSSGAEEAENALNDATKAAKELKNATLGIDELNILAPQENAAQNAFGGDLGLELPEYDFLGDATSGIDAFKEKIMSVFSEIAEIFEPVTKIITQFFNTLKEQFTQFKWGDALVESFWATLEALSAAAETFVDIVAPILEGLNIPAIAYEGIELFTRSMEVLKATFDSFNPAIETFIENGIKPIAEWIGGKVVDAISFLNEQFSKIGAWISESSPRFEHLSDTVTNVTTAIWNLLEPILNIGWENFKNNLSLIVDLSLGFSSAIGTVTEKFLDFVDAELNWWNNTAIPFLQSIPEEIGSIVNGIQMWFDSLPEKIGYGLGYALVAITNWVNDAVEWFKSLPSKMYEALTAGITTITIWGSQLIAKAQEVLPEVVEKVVDVFKSIPGKLRELGGSIVSGLIEGIKSSYESLKEDFNSFVNGFVQGFKDALGIHSPSTVFAEIGNNVVAGLMNGLGFFTNVLGTVKEWGGNIIEWFNKGEDTKNVVDSFKGTAESLVAGFKDTLTTKYIDSRSAVTSWASGVKQWFSEIASPNVFAQVAVSIVNGFKDSIINQYGTVKSAMAEFGNAVIDAFERPNGRRSIVTEFEIIGTNVIEGFIEGTSSLWDEAERVIRAFAENIIDSAKDELDEHSPSRIFKEIGAYTVQGFNIGVQREAASSLNVMNSWLTGVKDAIPSFGVGFEMDYSNIRSFNPESFTQGISANMTASGTATVVGFKEAMEEFYSEMLYPMISQIADDMRRQADKEETTVVNIGNRTVTEAVSAQQSANGYRFVTT